MNPLSGIAGVAVDRILGIRSAGVPFVLRRDVAVEMPDGVALLGDHYRPAGDDRPLPVVLIRSPYGRAGLPGVVFDPSSKGAQAFVSFAEELVRRVASGQSAVAAAAQQA